MRNVLRIIFFLIFIAPIKFYSPKYKKKFFWKSIRNFFRVGEVFDFLSSDGSLLKYKKNFSAKKI